MEISDPIVRRYAQDYQIHLINPNQIADEELGKFQSSLREVMGCIKYSRSKEKLAAFINNNPIYRVHFLSLFVYTIPKTQKGLQIISIFFYS